MKRIITYMMIILIPVATMVGCFSKQAGEISIINNWEMEFISDIDGNMLVTSTNNKDFTGEKIDMTGQFNEDGTFTLTNLSSNEKWNGTFKEKAFADNATLFEITFEDDTVGSAVVGKREYQGDKEVGSLTISTDNRIISFVEKDVQ